MPESKKKRTGLLSPPMTAGLGIAGLGGLGALTARAADYHPEARQHVADAFARMNATNDPVERLVNYLDMGRAQSMPTYGKATGLDLMQNAFTHGTALNSIGQKFHERFKKDWNEPIHYGGGGGYSAPFSKHYTAAAQGPVQALENISKEVHAPAFHAEIVGQLNKNVSGQGGELTPEQQLDAVRKTLQENPAAAEGLDRMFSPHGQEYDLLSRVLAAPGEAAHAAGQASPYLIGGGLGLAGAAGIYKLYKHLAAKKKLNSSSAAEHSMTPKLAADLRILEAGGPAAYQLLVKRAAFGVKQAEEPEPSWLQRNVIKPVGDAYSTHVAPAVQKAQDYVGQQAAHYGVNEGLKQIGDTYNNTPWMNHAGTGALYGAGIGGLLGLGSEALSSKKKKNYLGSALSGGALGGLVGGTAGGLYGAYSTPEEKKNPPEPSVGDSLRNTVSKATSGLDTTKPVQAGLKGLVDNTTGAVAEIADDPHKALKDVGNSITTGHNPQSAVLRGAGQGVAAAGATEAGLRAGGALGRATRLLPDNRDLRTYQALVGNKDHKDLIKDIREEAMKARGSLTPAPGARPLPAGPGTAEIRKAIANNPALQADLRAVEEKAFKGSWLGGKTFGRQGFIPRVFSYGIPALMGAAYGAAHGKGPTDSVTGGAGQYMGQPAADAAGNAYDRASDFITKPIYTPPGAPQ